MEEVNAVKVGSALGTAIDSTLAMELQESYGQFAAQFDPEEEEAKKRLGEMVSLLEVNERNLREVQNQGWFKRAWATVSGKNRGLARVNEANLAKVQAGSVYFLERLAAQGQISMRSVAFALKRLEDLQISNERLKGYLLRAVEGYNHRLQIVEGELQDHGKRIDHLEGRVRRWPRYLAFATVVVVGLVAAVLPPLLGRGLLSAIPGAAICILGLALILRPKVHPEDAAEAGAARATQTRWENRQGLALRNAEAARRLRDLATREFQENLGDAHQEILGPFAEFYRAIPDGLADDPTSKQVAAWLDGWIAASPQVGEAMATACGQVAENVVNAINGWMSELLDGEGIKDIPGAELRIHVGQEQLSALRREFESAIDPVKRTLHELERKRQQLQAAYPRYRKLLVEHPLKAGTRNFMKGFLIVPLLFDDENEFTSSFIENFTNYGQNIDNIKDQIIQSVEPLLSKQLNSFFEQSSNRLETLGKIFTEDDLELSNLLN